MVLQTKLCGESTNTYTIIKKHTFVERVPWIYMTPTNDNKRQQTTTYEARWAQLSADLDRVLHVSTIEGGEAEGGEIEMPLATCLR